MKTRITRNGFLILFLLAALMGPASAPHPAQASPDAPGDDEIIYIDASGFIRVIDPNVASGAQEIKWVSPEGGWFDFATGDFNNDGDAEIAAIGNGKLTIFDPVVQDSSITPDGEYNLVPWVRLHERAAPGTPSLIAAGNLDAGVAGDEIIYGYSVSEPNNINYRLEVLKTADGGRTWTTHLNNGYGSRWDFVTVGNVNNTGSDELLLIRNADWRFDVREVDNNFALIYSRSGNSMFTWRSGAIGQFYPGGSGEFVVARTFSGTDELASIILFSNPSNWDNIADGDALKFFPHPNVIVAGDVNGNGDDEIFWLRSTPDATGTRLYMINRGGDTLPGFSSSLDADNAYKAAAMGDPDGDGRDEIAVMRNDRIRYFYAVETGNAALFTDYAGLTTNSRSIKMANLDGEGYVPGTRFSATPATVQVTLTAGTSKQPNLAIDVTASGSKTVVPITVSKERGATWFDYFINTNQTPAVITISQFDARNLTPGVYTERLKVTSTEQVLNQPFYITIQMTVARAAFDLSPSGVVATFHSGNQDLYMANVALTGIPGVNYTAAIMDRPEFNAAVAALGQTPQFAQVNEEGRLVLMDGLGGSYVTSITLNDRTGERAATATDWPSGVPWATAASTGTTIPDTLTVTISPTLMTTSAGHALLLVVGDPRSGDYPENIGVVTIDALKTDNTPFYLPVLMR